MAKLVMLIDGLCAFVPSSHRDRMRVILVNGTGLHAHGQHACGGCAVEHGSMEIGIPPHYPFLRFPRARRIARINEEDRRPAAQVLLHNATEVRFFDWEELTIIREGGPPQPFRIADGRRPGTSEPFTPEEARDFSWLPELEKMPCDNAKIRTECLREDPPRHLVLGRLDLREGEISVDSIVQDLEADTNVIWEFGGGDAHASYSQAAAALIRYELEFEGDFITLRLGRFGSEQFVDIKLRPNRRGIVPVEVGNLPLEDVIDLKVKPRSLLDSLSHFGLLYGLAQDPHLLPLVPRPVGRARLVAGRDTRGGTTMCLGLTYAGSDI